MMGRRILLFKGMQIQSVDFLLKEKQARKRHFSGRVCTHIIFSPLQSLKPYLSHFIQREKNRIKTSRASE